MVYFWGDCYYIALTGSHVLESCMVANVVALWQPEMAKMAMKLFLEPLQKQSLGGCTISMPFLNCHWCGVVCNVF